MTDAPLIEVSGLKKYFETESGLFTKLLDRDTRKVRAVDDVNLQIRKNEAHGVIGESGCGKTTLLNTIVGLHPPTAGEVRYKGMALSDFSSDDWTAFRRNVQLIFQDPFNSLDPRMSVEETLREPLAIHDIPDRHVRIREVLERVELSPPDRYRKRLPAQLSGGERQRVSIARALILDPDVLLADEPVSMLDVSTQASILNLLSELRDELDLSLLYISHDLSTVAHSCDSVHVMYLGRIVESALTEAIIDDPKHPYTQALIQAIPVANPDTKRSRTDIEGAPESQVVAGSGCRFRDRCPEYMEVCEQTPPLETIDDGREVACHLYADRESGTGDDQVEVSRDG